MFSFEGDFKTRPKVSLGGASRKVRAACERRRLGAGRGRGACVPPAGRRGHPQGHTGSGRKADGCRGRVRRDRPGAARMLRVDGPSHLDGEKLGARDTVFLSEMSFGYFVSLDIWW